MTSVCTHAACVSYLGNPINKGSFCKEFDPLKRRMSFADVRMRSQASLAALLRATRQYLCRASYVLRIGLPRILHTMSAEKLLPQNRKRSRASRVGPRGINASMGAISIFIDTWSVRLTSPLHTACRTYANTPGPFSWAPHPNLVQVAGKQDDGLIWLMPVF